MDSTPLPSRTLALSLMDDPEERIQEQALNLVRNLVCGPEEDIQHVFEGMAELSSSASGGASALRGVAAGASSSSSSLATSAAKVAAAGADALMDLLAAKLATDHGEV